jgi:hypothetical protein
MNVLLVLPDQEIALAAFIKSNVRASFTDRRAVSFQIAKNSTEAWALALAETFHLVITSFNIPPDAQSLLNAEAHLGLTLASKLRFSRPALPVILIGDYLDQALYLKVVDLEPCELVLREGDWERGLRWSVRKLLPQSESWLSSAPCFVDIALNLKLRRGSYRIRSPSIKRPFGVLDNVNFFNLERLVDATSDVGYLPPERWENKLKEIGSNLFTELFTNHFQFTKDFAQATCENRSVRMRFVIEPALHAVALEALVDENQEFWMLRTPVSRKIETNIDVNPLFSSAKSDPRPLRCLIIEAPTEGSVPGFSANGTEVYLRPLKHVTAEAIWLKDFLESKGMYAERLVESHGSPVSTRVLEAGLETAPWDMVHFIGHSYSGRGTDTRTVIFVTGQTAPVPVDVEVFALLLRDAKTRFVYLSSCSSAAFALQLALKQVSSIIGYHWEISDDAARVHTERFYTNLFTGFPSLDFAFLQTRKDMSRRREDRVWAASVLVDQVEE